MNLRVLPADIKVGIVCYKVSLELYLYSLMYRCVRMDNEKVGGGGVGRWFVRECSSV